MLHGFAPRGGWRPPSRLARQRAARLPLRTVTLLAILLALRPAAAWADDGFRPLFDGKTLQGWEGNLKLFRVEDGAIVGGNLKERIAHNEFLCTTQEFEDFELRLECKLVGEGANAGIQFRSRRIPNHHEVIGYQADMGAGWWGKLYDESRRRRVLAGPADEEALRQRLRPDDWNEYLIRCQGPRIQLWLNGVQTVDYTEPQDDIPRRGIIGLQIHGGPPSEAWYRNVRIRELKPAP